MDSQATGSEVQDDKHQCQTDGVDPDPRTPKVARWVVDPWSGPALMPNRRAEQPVIPCVRAACAAVAGQTDNGENWASNDRAEPAERESDMRGERKVA